MLCPELRAPRTALITIVIAFAALTYLISRNLTRSLVRLEYRQQLRENGGPLAGLATGCTAAVRRSLSLSLLTKLQGIVITVIISNVSCDVTYNRDQNVSERVMYAVSIRFYYIEISMKK